MESIINLHLHTWVFSSKLFSSSFMLFVQPFQVLTESRLLGRLPTIRHFSASSARARQRLVILGSGWGGYNVLRSIDKKRWGVCFIFPTILLYKIIFFQMSPYFHPTRISTSRHCWLVRRLERWNSDVRWNRSDATPLMWYVLRDISKNTSLALSMRHIIKHGVTI